MKKTSRGEEKRSYFMSARSNVIGGESSFMEGDGERKKVIGLGLPKLGGGKLAEGLQEGPPDKKEVAAREWEVE